MGTAGFSSGFFSGFCFVSFAVAEVLTFFWASEVGKLPWIALCACVSVCNSQREGRNQNTRFTRWGREDRGQRSGIGD